MIDYLGQDVRYKVRRAVDAISGSIFDSLQEYVDTHPPSHLLEDYTFGSLWTRRVRALPTYLAPLNIKTYD